MTDQQIIDAMIKLRSDRKLLADHLQVESDTTPLSEQAVDQAEQRLGFKIPLLLRRIYTTISNGGFGDSYGTLGLMGGPVNEERLDAISLYESFRKPDATDNHWNWPVGLLPWCHLGCAMFHCVKCDAPPYPIIWFEPNPHETGQPWDDAFIPFCASLSEYLTAWLQDDDLWSHLITVEK